MVTKTSSNPNAEKSDWRETPFEYPNIMEWLVDHIGRLGIVLGLLILVFGFLVAHDVANLSLRDMVSDLYANWGTEFLSIAITVFVLDRRNQTLAMKQEKNDLILQMGSPDNGFAREAVRKLRARGWLTDGSTNRVILTRADLNQTDLRRASLFKADMGGCDLGRADLEKAELREADLFAADLEEAKLLATNLRYANLLDANLCRAKLILTDLSGADLLGSNLIEASLNRAILRNSHLGGANLIRANLHKVDLTNAILVGASLSGAKIQDVNLDGATMPNGEKWYPGMDLEQFTNPDHPNFWRPDDPTSPASQGNDPE